MFLTGVVPRVHETLTWHQQIVLHTPTQRRIRTHRGELGHVHRGELGHVHRGELGHMHRGELGHVHRGELGQNRLVYVGIDIKYRIVTFRLS